MAFQEKKCLGCQQTFRPNSGRQEKCDPCRSVVEVSLLSDGGNHKEKSCARCGVMFMPHQNGQKKCDECRSIFDFMKNEKPCQSCGKMFLPRAKQKWCDDCRAGDSVERCSCGSPISGRARWGNQWGGGCDRAEERAVRLMRLQRTSHLQ